MIEYTGFSDKGNSRKGINQDAILMLVSGDVGLFAVCDGIGGLNAGEKASREAISAVHNYWMDQDPDIEGYTIERIRKDLEQIIFRVNDRLVNTTPRTGTTIVLLILVKNEYEVLWAGDSRCYRLSWKEPDVLIRLTEDHVWENDSGFTEGLTEKEIAEHKFRGRITNALGLRRPGRIDRISGKADSGEAFILCSDGIYKYVDEEVLFERGRNLMETDLLETVSEDIRREVSRNGAGDNLSLLLVRVS